MHDQFDLLVSQACRQPNQVALEVPHPESPGQSRQVTWQRLLSAVRTLASELSALGVSPRTPVGYASRNELGDVLLSLSCVAVGAIEVPIEHRLREDEVARRWGQFDGRWIDSRQLKSLTDAALRHPIVFEDERTTPDLSRPSLVLWTSGTTSRSRGVVLTQQNLVGNAAAKLAAVPEQSDDLRLCSLPLCHAYARTCDMGTWLHSGCTLALGLGFEAWRDFAPIVKPTIANTVPRLAARLLVEADNAVLGRLRLIGCGGAAMEESEFSQWRQRGVVVIQGYGLTETAPVICSATPETALPGLVGTFVDGWEYDIRAGELYVRGPHTMLEYWNDPHATKQRIDADGWLATGDLVEIDESSGQLRILDRKDDVIVLPSGRKVFPQAVERLLGTVDGVDHLMLLCRDDQLECWYCGSTDATDLMRDKFDHLETWQQPKSINRWSEPLSIDAGELTAKGTLRRKQIIKNRFGTERD